VEKWQNGENINLLKSNTKISLKNFISVSSHIKFTDFKQYQFSGEGGGEKLASYAFVNSKPIF